MLILYSSSEHEANTERLITKHTSMRHVEGGWPKDVDFTEQVGSVEALCPRRFNKTPEELIDF